MKTTDQIKQLSAITDISKQQLNNIINYYKQTGDESTFRDHLITLIMTERLDAANLQFDFNNPTT